MTISKKLIVGVTILLLFISGTIGGISVYQANNAVHIQLEENIPQMAVYGAMAIKNKLEFLLSSMDGIAIRHVIKSMDWKLQKPALEKENTRLKFLGMGIIKPDGQAIYPDGTTSFLGDRDYFKRAMKGETNISDILISRVTNLPVMMIASPIKDDNGNVKGVLLARLNGDWLCEYTDKIGYGKKGYSYIIDKKGTLIAHKNRSFVIEQKNFIEEAKTKPEFTQLSLMFKKMIKGEKGTSEYPFMGSDRFFGFAPIEGTGWSIAVGAQKKIVFHEIFHLMMTIIIISVIIIFIGIFLTIMLSRSILNPIKQTIIMLKDLSEGEGDLTKHIVADSNDEISQMAEYFNIFIEKNRVIIQELKKISFSIAASTEQASATTVMLSDNEQQAAAMQEEILSSVEESVKSVQSVAFDTDVQNNSFENLSSRMIELSKSVEELATETKNARSTTDSIKNKVISGNESLGNLNHIMVSIETGSLKMNDILSIINDISDKINLLSLNASIEAARAGEHGRGFAVVAEEISKLADGTAASIKDIDIIIKLNSVEIASGRKSLDTTNGIISSIISDITHINDIITKMFDFMQLQIIYKDSANREAETMKELTKNINESIGQHQTLTTGINSIIKNLTELGQSNASSSEELAATTEQIAGMAEELNDIASRFKTE